MKVRVISDLHLDVNKLKPFSLKKDGTFTVICGDTSGDPNKSIPWIHENVGKGLVVAGNHLVYNGRKCTIEYLRCQMAGAFKKGDDVEFLESCDGGSFSKVVDGVLFLGSCLYTDMQWTNECDKGFKPTVEMNRSVAYRSMNDFRWGKVSRKKGHLGAKAGMLPGDYEHWFKKTVDAFDKALDENEKSDNPLPCFIVTHHAPSGKCIPRMYSDSAVNCAYVSDLEWFIEKHKSIKCWAYGHIHMPTEFQFARKDGSEVLMVNNPRGYVSWGESLGFDENLTVDTETWKVERTSKKKISRA